MGLFQNSTEIMPQGLTQEEKLEWVRQRSQRPPLTPAQQIAVSLQREWLNQYAPNPAKPDRLDEYAPFFEDAAVALTAGDTESQAYKDAVRILVRGLLLAHPTPKAEE